MKTRFRMIAIMVGIILGVHFSAQFSPAQEKQDIAKRIHKQTKIAFCSYRNGNWDIYVMNADGSNQTRLTKDSAIDAGPVWSPYGKKIAFVSNRNGNREIYVMNTDGTQQINLTNNLADDVNPSWSPDGNKIAFGSNRDGNLEIYVMNTDGSKQKRLTKNSSIDIPCSWSPDGKKLVFMSDRGGDFIEIYVMNVDGSQQKRLTKSFAEGSGSRDPHWSPNGNEIAFSSNRDGNSEIYVMNADGSKQKRLTNHPAIDAFPSWSPDGNKIIFSSERDGKGEIYVMNADGSQQKRLTTNLATNAFPSWSPFFHGKKHFQAGDISFDYPKEWISWEKDSFNRMRSFLKSQGADLLVMLKTKDETRIIQVTKQRNPSSFDSLYEDKKKVADQVTAEGIEIMGERFVRYFVNRIVLPGGQKAVLGHAEKPTGETGISYQLLSGGYEYNVNFIYQSVTAAVKDEKLREQVMSTFKILEMKTPKK